LPDSRGAGAGRMPPLLGRPEGQNEMALDLKDVDLKDVDLKSRRQAERNKIPSLSITPLSGTHLIQITS